MSAAFDLSLYAKPDDDGRLSMDLAVEGVTCGACIGRIEGAVKQLPGIAEARLNYTNRRLHVVWSDGAVAQSVGLLASALGEQDAARTQLARAISMNERASLVLRCAEAQLQLANELSLQPKDLARAQSLARSARAAAESCGALGGAMTVKRASSVQPSLDRSTNNCLRSASVIREVSRRS